MDIYSLELSVPYCTECPYYPEGTWSNNWEDRNRRNPNLKLVTKKKPFFLSHICHRHMIVVESQLDSRYLLINFHVLEDMSYISGHLVADCRLPTQQPLFSFSCLTKSYFFSVLTASHIICVINLIKMFIFPCQYWSRTEIIRPSCDQWDIHGHLLNLCVLERTPINSISVPLSSELVKK